MIRSLLLALLVAAIAVPAWSQAELAGDRDGDGALSREEFQVSRRRLLLGADRDGDGKIGPAEWIAAETQLRRQLQTAGYRDTDADLGTGGYGKMDADKDRFIGAAEVDAYLARRFESMDADRDGSIDRSEFAATVDPRGR